MLRLAAYLAQPIKQSLPGAAELRAEGLAQAFVLVGHAIGDHRYVTPGDFAAASAFDVVRP